MKGKNILVTVALVLGFGGIVANTCVGINNKDANKKLEDEISNLRSDMEAADEANKAEVKAELTAMINQTRDNLKAAYEAADASMQNGLDQLRAELEAEIEDLAELSEAGDKALATQIANKFNQILDAIQGVADNLQDAVEEHESDVQDLVNAILELEADVEDLTDRVDDLDSFADAVTPILSSFITTLNGLQSTVGALADSLDALEARLDGEYYSISQVDALLNSVNSAISTLTGLFKVNGTIVSMADLMDQLDDKFADFAAQIALCQTKADAQAAAQDLADAIEEINDKLDAFYGTAAKEAKGQLVNKLTQFYTSFKAAVIDARKAQIEANNGGTLPAVYASLFADIDVLYATNLRAVLDEGIARIILAADVTEATAMEAEFELRMNSVMYKIMFLADKEVAAADLLALKTTDCPVNFTDAEVAYYQGLLDAVTFDDAAIATASAQEATEYYAGLRDKLDSILVLAEGYNAVVKAVRDANLALEANTALTTAQLNTFKNYNVALAAFGNYESATSVITYATDATVEDQVDEILDVYADKMEVVAYGAAAYNGMAVALSGALTAMDALTMDPTQCDAFKDRAESYAEFNSFDADFEEILGLFDTVDEAKEDIDALVDTFNSDLTVTAYAADIFAEIYANVGAAHAAVAAATNLTADQKDDFSALIDDYSLFADYIDILDANVATSCTKTDAEKKADFDDAKEDIANDMEVILYAASSFDGVVAGANSASAAIDALTNISDTEKDEFKLHVDESLGFTGYFNSVKAIVASYDEVDDAKDAIDELADADLAGKVAAIQYAAEQYDAIRAIANANEAAVSALANIETLDQDAINLLSELAIAFTNYDNNVEDFLANFVDLDSAKASVDAEIEDEKADLDHIVLIANALNELNGYRKAKETAINALTDLVANGHNDYFNDVLDDLFDLSSVIADTNALVTAAEFDAYVDDVKDEMDNVNNNAALQNSMESAYAAADAFLDANYTATYQVEYFKKVNKASFENYSLLNASGIKAGIDVTTPESVTDSTNAAGLLGTDISKVKEGAATFKVAYDKGVTVRAQMEGYIDTYKAIFLGVCDNDNDDELTVWANHTAEIVALEDQYAYTYGANLGAVPAIAADEAYATTMANFDAYIAGIEDNATIDARYDAYKAAVDALLPAMKAEFKQLDLAYALELAKAAIGDNLDGTTGTFKATFDTYLAQAGSDGEKVASLNSSYTLCVYQIADAATVSSAQVKSVITSAVAYWATIVA